MTTQMQCWTGQLSPNNMVEIAAIFRLDKWCNGWNSMNKKIEELGQLSNEASQSFANLEQQAQSREHTMALQYLKLTHTLNEKAHEALKYRMESSSRESELAATRETIEMIKGEERMAKEEANSAILAAESGVFALQDRLNKAEVAKHEANVGMQQAELHAQQALERERPITALHSELGELRLRHKQQEEYLSIAKSASLEARNRG
ncbi:unnamed protein product [Symbiodinium sp. CCMP2456]|nr:unnamed protein product [Symbiodinium sp. CCMP2456]